MRLRLLTSLVRVRINNSYGIEIRDRPYRKAREGCGFHAHGNVPVCGDQQRPVASLENGQIDSDAFKLGAD